MASLRAIEDLTRRRNDAVRWNAITIAITVIGLLGSTLLYISGQVESLGRWIPQSDIQQDYMWGIAAWLGLYLLLLVLPLTQVEHRLAPVAWAVRLLVTMVGMLFYESNYAFIDSYSYFSVPAQAGFFEFDIGFGKGTEVIYTLNYCLYLLMPYSYHATKVIYSFIGLLAIIVAYRAFVTSLGREDEGLFLLLNLFPSNLFWSSTLGKDPLTLLGISLFIYGMAQVRATGLSLRYGGVALIGIVGTMWIRPWVGVPLAMSVIALFGLSARHRMWPIIASALAAIAIFVVADRLEVSSQGDVLETLDFQSRAWAEEGGAGQVVQQRIDTNVGAIAFAPLGAFTAVFRPFPGEVLNAFGWMAGIENAALLALFILSVVWGRRYLFGNAFLRFVLAYGVLWALMYGFVSYQNLGTAVRFKLQVLPFLVGLIYVVLRTQDRAVVLSVWRRW